MTSRWQRRSPVAIALLCAVAGCGPDGPPPEASGPCAAGDCRIALEHIARITDADDPGILSPDYTWFQETEAGTFVTASMDLRRVSFRIF